MASDLIRLPEPNASATVHGLSGWIVMDDPPPEGLERLIVAAGAEVPMGSPEWTIVEIGPLRIFTAWQNDERFDQVDLHPGCIVGAVTVAEAVAVVDAFATGTIPPYIRQVGTSALLYRTRYEPGSMNPSQVTDIRDQRPWNDWSPGRWAWRIENPKPTAEECPVCGGEVRWTHDGTWIDEGREPCVECRGDGDCPPFPYSAPEGLSVFDPGRLG